LETFMLAGSKWGEKIAALARSPELCIALQQERKASLYQHFYRE